MKIEITHAHWPRRWSRLSLSTPAHGLYTRLSPYIYIYIYAKTIYSLSFSLSLSLSLSLSFFLSFFLSLSFPISFALCQSISFHPTLRLKVDLSILGSIFQISHQYAHGGSQGWIPTFLHRYKRPPHTQQWQPLVFVQTNAVDILKCTSRTVDSTCVLKWRVCVGRGVEKSERDVRMPQERDDTVILRERETRMGGRGRNIGVQREGNGESYRFSFVFLTSPLSPYFLSHYYSIHLQTHQCKHTQPCTQIEIHIHINSTVERNTNICTNLQGKGEVGVARDCGSDIEESNDGRI